MKDDYAAVGETTEAAHKAERPVACPEHGGRCVGESCCCADLHGAPGDSIEQWQKFSAWWTDDRFPDDTLQWRGLVLGEETGEVLRCILKAEQGIRGGREKWLSELPSEVADVFFCLTALAHRAGFDLADAVAARWAELEQRTYEGGQP